MAICIQCNREFESKNKKAKFCSVQCKSDSQRGKKEKQNEGKVFRCKIDGKTLSGNSLTSGALKVYSREVLKKDYDFNDWELIDFVDTSKRWNCPECNDSFAIKLDIDSGGWIRRHLIEKHGYLDILDICTKYPDFKLLWPHSFKVASSEKFKSESEDNRIICLECGKWFSKITNSHLRDKHGMTTEEYKFKHPGAKLNSAELTERNKKHFETSLGKTVIVSRGHQEIKDFLLELGFNAITTRDVVPGELDMYLEEKKLAIEYNGLYHHSVRRGEHEPSYHLNKTVNCELLDIHLIHIFEDDWKLKPEIIKSRLKNILGFVDKKLYARKCEIVHLTDSESKDFLLENHIQGWTPSPINYGLIYNGELVSVMSFRIPRFKKIRSETNDFELLRFCTKLNTVVIGGASKLLSHFINDYDPDIIYSYADRCWTSTQKNTLYNSLGFVVDSITPPNYWYLLNYDRKINRMQFQAHKIKEKFPEFRDNWVNEKTAMTKLGYDWIYDCGSIKYILDRTIDRKSAEIGLEITQDLKDSKYRYIQQEVFPERENIQRKTYYTICKICNKECSTVGLRNHVEYKHGMKFSEYSFKYNHLNQKEEKIQKLLEEVGDKYKCLSCGERMISHKQLVQHINSKHESFEKYAIEFIFGGEFPTCACGCGKQVKIKTQPPYKVDYISGHNANGMSGKPHSDDTKQKQKEKAIGRFSLGWFVEKYGSELGMRKYEERSKSLSDRNKAWYSNKK